MREHISVIRRAKFCVEKQIKKKKPNGFEGHLRIQSPVSYKSCTLLKYRVRWSNLQFICHIRPLRKVMATSNDTPLNINVNHETVKPEYYG